MFSSGACARQSAAPRAERRRRDAVLRADLVHRHRARERDADARLDPGHLARDGGRGLDDRVGRRRPPGGLGLAHDHVDVAEAVLVEVAPEGVDHDPRVLVRDEPDVEPRVRLGGRHGLGRRVRVPGPQALEVEGRRERERMDGLGPVDAPVEALDLPVVADVVERREVLGRDDRELVLGRGAGAGVQAGDDRPPVVVPAASRAPAPAGARRWAARRSGSSARRGPSSSRRARARRCPCRRPGPSAGRRGRARRPRSARRRRHGDAGRRSSNASRSPEPVSSWPSTRWRTRHGSGPNASVHASIAQIRGSSSPLLSVAPRAQIRSSRIAGLYGGCRPQVERRGGLDVVVADAGERARPVAQLADDERRHVLAQLEDLHGAAGPAQPVRGPVGRGPEVVPVAALGRDAAEVEELGDPVLETLVDDGVEAREVGHGGPRRAQWDWWWAGPVSSACDRGRGTAAPRPWRRPGRGGPRPSTPPGASSRSARSAAGRTRARSPA